MIVSLIAALAMSAGAPTGITKAAADSQCKAGQSAPTGKVGEWAGGLHDGNSGLTPATVPGATRVSVDEMLCLSKAYGDRMVGLTPISPRESGIPGTWVVEGGADAGDFVGNVQETVTRQLHYALGTDLDRPMLVYCHNTGCFMSYNLSIRAQRAGYRNIYWLRGGMEEWQAKGGTLAPLKPAIAAVGDGANAAMMCVLYSTILAELKLISAKQYETYADALTTKLEAALAQPTRGELYADHLRYMTDNVGDAVDEYKRLLDAKDKAAPAFRKQNFAEYDRTCAALPEAKVGMFAG